MLIQLQNISESPDVFYQPVTRVRAGYLEGVSVGGQSATAFAYNFHSVCIYGEFHSPDWFRSDDKWHCFHYATFVDGRMLIHPLRHQNQQSKSDIPVARIVAAAVLGNSIGAIYNRPRRNATPTTGPRTISALTEGRGRAKLRHASIIALEDRRVYFLYEEQRFSFHFSCGVRVKMWCIASRRTEYRQKWTKLQQSVEHIIRDNYRRFIKPEMRLAKYDIADTVIFALTSFQTTSSQDTV
ncbi:Hypothetical_protein [Hexamita inflata]|uniref:Hypothetical_protein n=1 Tax=Hexamita inflata TaxID=28002 RepID=A0AA86P8U8_9EUKA|nr:Hypothetical protein HINF_LOCUS20696 [Hexamita inflata]